MFGVGGPGFLDATAKYYWGGCWLVLLVSAFAAFPPASAVGNRCLRRGGGWIVLSVAFFAAIFLLCIAVMMNDTYTTFLYFQF